MTDLEKQEFVIMMGVMAKECHQNAKDKGFYSCLTCEGEGQISGNQVTYVSCTDCQGTGESDPSIDQRLMLMMSELSEAYEEYRSGRAIENTYYEDYGGGRLEYNDGSPGTAYKPVGFLSELADCVIRIMDLCAWKGLDLGKMIVEKHNFNKGRPYRHGGKIA